MIQKYIQQSTSKVIETLEMAVGMLPGLRQGVLTPDILLLALISQPDSEPYKIIENLLPDSDEAIGQLSEQIRKNLQTMTLSQPAQQIVMSQEVEDVFRIALGEANNLGDKFIGGGALFIAMFDDSVGKTASLLRDAGLTRQHARGPLKEIRHASTLQTPQADSTPYVST